jgi:hypothetical protein
VHGALKTIIQQRLPKEVDAKLHLMEVLAEFEEDKQPDDRNTIEMVPIYCGFHCRCLAPAIIGSTKVSMAKLTVSTATYISCTKITYSHCFYVMCRKFL